jgi:hypothetical protein
MPCRSVILALFAGCMAASAQLPASGTLSDKDGPLFRTEVGRIEKLLSSAPDTATVTYQMARTWAAAKQWPETMQWLRKVADLRAGLDPSRDSVFADLRGTREFDAILSAVRESTPPVSHSTPAFIVAEGDLLLRVWPMARLTRTSISGALEKERWFVAHRPEIVRSSSAVSVLCSASKSMAADSGC